MGSTDRFNYIVSAALVVVVLVIIYLWGNVQRVGNQVADLSARVDALEAVYLGYDSYDSYPAEDLSTTTDVSPLNDSQSASVYNTTGYEQPVQ